MRLGVDTHGLEGILGIKSGQVPFEVNPINSPWIVDIGRIGMGDAGGKNEILVGLYLISVSVDAIPSASVHAIDENILVDGFFPFNVMVLSLRIISYVGNVQHGCQRVLVEQVDNDFG
jgi:hypothetical protein